MQDNRVCVGGVDLDNKCSVRLLNINGLHEHFNECPYNLLRIWEIAYSKTNKRPAPHLEDVAVHKRTKTPYIVKPKELPKLEKYNIKIFRHSLLTTFDGKLNSTDSGSLYISSQKGVTDYSTCFWVCDRDLIKNRFSTEQKIKYDYQFGTKWYHIPYVGLENGPDIIKSGTLIRLSLAHWWHPKDNNGIENRCYLQLSGFFSID